MYQPETRSDRWGYLGEEDELYWELGSQRGGRSEYELTPGVDNEPNLGYDRGVNQSKTTDMTPAEELNVLKLAREGCEKSKVIILDKYEPLCHKMARKYSFTAPHHDHADLVQEAKIALLGAIDSYTDKKGAKFFTWAFIQIRGSINSAGRVDRKQPAYPMSIEDATRSYNLEDPSQEIILREDIPNNLVRKIVEECCGGLHTKRANIVMDRFGLFGRKELRNCEAAEKYGISKWAVNSHTYSFKKKARIRFPHLINLI